MSKEALRNKPFYFSPRAELKDQIEHYFNTVMSQKESLTYPRIIRLEISIDAINPLNWLEFQKNEYKVYWQSRDKSFEMAGIGKGYLLAGRDEREIEEQFHKIHHLMADNERINFLGGIRFDPLTSSAKEWQKFSAYYFLLPRFEIRRDKGNYFLACNLFLSRKDGLENLINDVLNSLPSFSFDNDETTASFPEYITRQDNPDRQGWVHGVQSALNSFDKGELDKVVLARKSTFTVDQPLDPIQLMQMLEHGKPNTFLFLFQFGRERTFLGSTPERLYSRDHLVLETEAVAGTRPRGNTEQEDRRLRQDLFHSNKDLREHRYVVESIEERLNPYCRLMKKDKQVSILESTRVRHLRLGFHARLKENISDAQLLKALHPTPAVGGYPRKEALQKIREIEQFDRGWYAAPVGWINKDKSEFAVAIRSALIEGNHLHLYSGAGIVEGSNPDDEWREIENKISNYLKIIRWS